VVAPFAVLEVRAVLCCPLIIEGAAFFAVFNTGFFCGFPLFFATGFFVIAFLEIAFLDFGTCFLAGGLFFEVFLAGTAPKARGSLAQLPLAAVLWNTIGELA